MWNRKSVSVLVFAFIMFSILRLMPEAIAASEQFEGRVYAVGQLKPIDSEAKLKAGDKAPDFSLPSLSGEPVSLGQFLGKKNVVLSFVPGAWTPVCSEQWPGYNIAKSLFDNNNAVILGITVDSIPTLFSWTQQMGGVWFPVLSDFWPHGEVSGRYGVFRSNGTSERALFLVDKLGIVRYMDVHDINERPNLEVLVRELEKLGN
jgi:peroxiredoxin (alkyl hydroperoxide reductase subunit C)